MQSDEPLSNYEEIVFASDGHQEYLLTTKTKVISPDGSLFGILGIGRDLTQLNNYEKNLFICIMRLVVYESYFL